MTTNYNFKKFQMLNSICLLRILLGLIMISHGSARIYYNTVSLFGDFLTSKSFIFGDNIAWCITILDIAFGLCLLFNKLVNCSSLWFIFVLIMGIILVHFQNGWFVVGHGQNGVEYSVLLICCFIVLITNPSTTKLKETVNTDQ